MKYWNCNELNETKEINMCDIYIGEGSTKHKNYVHIHLCTYLFLTSIFIDGNVESKVQRKKHHHQSSKLNKEINYVFDPRKNTKYKYTYIYV